MPTFVLGFKQIADRHPELIGTPLENEAGPWQNASLQRTSNGVLVWGDYNVTGTRKGFIDTRDGKRYAWDKEAEKLVEIPFR